MQRHLAPQSLARDDRFPRITTAERSSPRKSLFDSGPPQTPAGPLSGLFADIVFDRPLDHAFTYSVPDGLAGAIGVGKRVEVPLGKGSKATSGFCVRVKDEQPTSTFPIKPVARVLDEDALVDDHLMKLTRWAMLPSGTRVIIRPSIV